MSKLSRMALLFKSKNFHHIISSQKALHKVTILVTISISQFSFFLINYNNLNLKNIYISYQMIALQNYERCFLFHLNSSFRSQDIHIFVFLSPPLFLPVSHCFRAWSKVNFKVYDIISNLHMNLLTHFVWYLEKEKGMTLKLCPLIEY